MKKITLSLIFIVCSMTSFSQTNYYWYNGEKIALERVDTKHYIVVKGNENSENLTRNLKENNINIGKLETINIDTGLKNFTTPNSRKWAIATNTNVRNLEGNENILYHAPFFLTPNKIEAGLSNLFYVKLKEAEDIELLTETALQKNVEIVGNNKFMPLWYTLSCSKNSAGNALEMANYFYESGLFQASQPDLMTDDNPLCVNDTHFTNQWNLNNTGQNNGTNGIDINFCEARNITTGDQNIIVAVLDQGVELNHPDITNMHAISFDTESGTSPSQVLGNHGTACAGIIGANSNNGDGVAGIAPDSPIMSISNSLNATPNSRQRRADGINFAVTNGASVISNSWGSAIQYQIIDDAIANALENGRNGLGSVVVFASGNDNGAVNYPANSNPDILVVGAMSPCGERKSPNSCDGENWGGNFGNELDVVAPGVLIPTTDRQGANGYNTNAGVAGNFTQNFNGTSSACPHVAAVAALVLSVNPNLTVEEVNNIIESTTQKVGNYNYSGNANRPNGTWNNEMGYGLLDAFAAVQAASGVTLNGPDIICSLSTETFSLLQGGTNVTWSSSSNVEIVSSSDNYASIKPKYSSSIGDGWLTATLNNNQTITRTFGVNQNFGDDPMSVTYYRYSTYLDVTVHGGSGETPYYWYLNNIFQRTTTLRTTTFYYTSSSGRIEVRNDNACGTGQNIAYYTGYFGGGYSYSAYPNPASSEIYIEETDEKGDKIKTNQKSPPPNYKFLDFNGNEVLSGLISSPRQKIDLDGLNNGLYFLIIQKGEGEEVHKIVVER